MREIKFRAWDREEKRMTDANFSISRHGKIWWLNSDGALCGAFENPSYAPHYPLQSGFVLMQFTGLKDKNSLKELYEGDIIDADGNLKGNIYESPQIYEEGIDCLIEGMGTEKWRSTESIAMGRGCKYTK